MFRTNSSALLYSFFLIAIYCAGFSQAQSKVTKVHPDTLNLSGKRIYFKFDVRSRELKSGKTIVEHARGALHVKKDGQSYLLMTGGDKRSATGVDIKTEGSWHTKKRSKDSVQFLEPSAVRGKVVRNGDRLRLDFVLIHDDKVVPTQNFSFTFDISKRGCLAKFTSFRLSGWGSGFGKVSNTPGKATCSIK